MATDYTPGEIAFFKAMVRIPFIMISCPMHFKVEQIMLSAHESYSISSLAALREISFLKPKSNMSKSQAEVVLASFVAKGWLLKSKQVFAMYSVGCVLTLYEDEADTLSLPVRCSSSNPISSRPTRTKSTSV
jgi:hypothetical protein